MRDGQALLVQDDWRLLGEEEASEQESSASPPDENLVWPLAYWQKRCEAKHAVPAVWLRPDQALDPIVPHCPQLALIALEFPLLSDGRAFSLARSLRSRYHYDGELRAVGEFMADQVFYMTRCGFDAFAPSSGKAFSSKEGLSSWLRPFSAVYQVASDDADIITEKRKK